MTVETRPEAGLNLWQKNPLPVHFTNLARSQDWHSPRVRQRVSSSVLLTFLRGVNLVLRSDLVDHRREVAPADVDAVPQDGGGRRGGLAADDAVVENVVRILPLLQSISDEIE